MKEKSLIQMLATKNNMSLAKIEEIVGHQFKFVHNKMKEGNFETVRLPYFGKFSVNPKRVVKLNKKNETSR